MAHVPLGQVHIPRAQHRAFLERAAAADEGAAIAAVTLGAFLVLRVVDQATDSPSPAALRQQLEATRALIDRLPTSRERQHLTAIVDGVESEAAPLLDAALDGYAAWLETAMRLAEAMDVTDTLIRVREARTECDAVHAYLRRARLLRLQTRFAEAQRAYDVADRLAADAADTHAGRLSRIGRALVLQKTGDLPASELLLRQVIASARDAGDRDAEAGASHRLACMLHDMGRGTQAVTLAYRAWCLYDDPLARLRAMNDAGQFLKELGYHDAAAQALTIVLAHDPPFDIRVRTSLELMEVHAVFGDRLTFERIRRGLEQEGGALAVDERLDLALKTGIGCALLGQLDEAIAVLDTAVRLAERLHLGERLFAAESLRGELQRCLREHTTYAHEVVSRTPTSELERTMADLEQLAPAR